MKKNLYHKIFKINNISVNFLIKSNFFRNINGIYFFGNPIYKNFDKLNSYNIKKEIQNIGGYFLIVSKYKNNLTIYNDILGNFRIYYKIFNKDKIFISNNINFFVRNNKIGKLNKEEFNFWKSKNYTSGDDTFYQELKKLPPASSMIFKDNKLKIIDYFVNHIKETDFDEILSVNNSLISSIKLLKKRKKKIILLFSGGVDSLLLAQKLIETNTNFECVYFSTEPKTYESEKGKLLVLKFSKNLNLKLKIIKIKININEKYFKNILKNMLFDFHTCFLQYYGIKKILSIYGKNIEIVSGQSADSILCFGPSAFTLSNFVNRLLYLCNNIFTNFLILLFLQIKYRIKLLSPKNNFEKLYYFYYGFFYYPFFKKENFNNDDKIKLKIKKKIEKFNLNKKYLKMYLKIFGFLQGSDNQILIQSCLNNGFSNILLPYAKSDIITSTCKKQNKLKSLFFPKYEIYSLLNKNLKNSISSFKFTNNMLRKHRYYIPRIKKIYIKKINEYKK